MDWKSLQNIQAAQLRALGTLPPPLPAPQYKSVMEGYQEPPPVDENANTEPPLEAPMFAPDDLIGTGVGKALLGPIALLAKMALSRGGKNVPRRFNQSGALIQGNKDPLNLDLTPIHKTSIPGLLKTLQDPSGLFAPSYAITKGSTLGDKFGNITLALRGEAVDPANRPGLLFNRDAYTARIPATKEDKILEDMR